ncbi:MAG: class I SAM-dependent methyltransferase [Oligoflexia bacterium]|nr:class I SAM-dependent methyltransferase [Oligoflexia bacterium]
MSGPLAFDPTHPFPLLPEGSHSYPEAQAHAEAVDAWLGLRTAEIEAELAVRPRPEGQQLWIGTPTRVFLTPYTELRLLLDRLAPGAGTTIVDLGAGYGRMGFVLGVHHPGVRFLGYEFVEERVKEGQRGLARWTYPGIELRQADLAAASFLPEPADFYFIYDYGTREAIEKTLGDLREIARLRPLTVIGRGRASRDAIERRHPWLSQVVPPRHFGHYSIYRTRAG